MAQSLSSHATWSGISATTWSSALSTLTSDPAIKEIELASSHADTHFFLGRVGTKYIRRIERGELEVLQEILEPWPSTAEMTPPRRNPPFMEPPPLKRSYGDMPPLETQGERLVFVDDEVPSSPPKKAMSVDSMPSLIHPADAHHILFCTACDEEVDGLRVGNLCAPCWQDTCGCETTDREEEETAGYEEKDWYFHTPPMPATFDMYHPHTLLQFLNFITSVNMYAKNESSMFFFDMIPKEIAAGMLDHPWVSGTPSPDDDWNGGPATAKEVHDLKTLLSDFIE